MSTPPLFQDSADQDNEAGPDLIDRIADALPVEVRADYYREMSHLRVLPEADEMLRILRAMQFLALLIEQAPAKMAEQREQLAQLLSASLKEIQAAHQANVAYHRQLEQRLAQLPAEIAKGISPQAIAEKINESLRQQFAQSGIPETAKSLSVVSKQLQQATGEFQATASRLTTAYTGAAAKADTAIANMERSIYSAANTAKQAANDLARTFLREYKWSVIMLTAAALTVGFLLGGLFVYSRTPAPEIAPAPAAIVAPSPAVPNPAPAKPKGRKPKAQEQTQPSQ